MNPTLITWLVIIGFIIFAILKYQGKNIWEAYKKHKQKKENDTRIKTKD